MHILLCNDDGVTHPGLLAMVQTLGKKHKISILAPDTNWSACGHVKTLHRPLLVKEVNLADGTPALACDGAPSDCVAIALLGVIEEPIDLVVTGINPHANLGHDVTYSGTVTSAIEAVYGGVPGIAVSLETGGDFKDEKDFLPAAEAFSDLLDRFKLDEIPEKTVLSVNLPYIKDGNFKGVQITRLGKRIYRDELIRNMGPKKREYYWIGGEHPVGEGDVDTDIGAIREGYISVTPLYLDMSSAEAREVLKKWDL